MPQTSQAPDDEEPVSIRLLLRWSLLLSMLSTATPVFGQTPGAPTDDRDEIIQKLLQRVGALEREVMALQGGKLRRRRMLGPKL